MIGSKKQLCIAARMQHLKTVISFVEKHLFECGCPETELATILVCTEEIFVNISNYAYYGEEGKCMIELETNPCEVNLTFSDEGKPFNPLKTRDPDITLSAQERKVGGLGIYMVKNSMDKLEYRYENNKNILFMTKKW